MDEISVERMILKYKDSGQMAREDPALLMLKQWPAAKQYKNNPEDLSALEQMVSVNKKVKLKRRWVFMDEFALAFCTLKAVV